MFSSNLKRSVATLGVVAGLLAAAVPASAMVGGDEADTVTGKAAVLTDYDRNGFSPQAPTSDGLISITADAGSGNDNLRADSNEVAVEGITLGVVTNNNDPDTMGRTHDNTPMDEVVFSATSTRTGPRAVEGITLDHEGFFDIPAE